MDARQIRAIRTAAGLSQEALAQQIGCSVRSINRWENGVRPAKRTARRLEKWAEERGGGVGEASRRASA